MLPDDDDDFDDDVDVDDVQELEDDMFDPLVFYSISLTYTI